MLIQVRYRAPLSLIGLSLLFLTACAGQPPDPEPPAPQETSLAPFGEATSTATSAPPADPSPEAPAPSATPFPTVIVPPTAPPAPTAIVPPTATPPAPIDKLSDVSKAIIQLQSDAAPFDFDFEFYRPQLGHGSGFIIDPSGLALTNNHVVAGTTRLTVWVGEGREERGAILLGVSECADLALIDLDGEEYPFLAWSDQPLPTGSKVFAAGFPEGEPVFKVTEGIVTQASAPLDTYWASINSVIFHSAPTAPGSSGGPLLTEDGRVAGVHYGNNVITGANLAIDRTEVLPLIETLGEGQDYDSIGIHPNAVYFQNGQNGIAVLSVRAGSPADQAGLAGGHIIETIGEFPIALDGTMGSYCGTLETHRAKPIFKLGVLDWTTGERFTTQLTLSSSGGGGDSSPTEDLPVGDVQPTATVEGTTPPYDRVVDVTGQIEIEVPAGWTDRETMPYIENDGELIGPAINASTDLDAMRDRRVRAPGVFFSASEKWVAEGVEARLDSLQNGQMSEYCTVKGRRPYNDGVYLGYEDRYTNCGSSGMEASVIAALPDEGTPLLLVIVFAPNDASGAEIYEEIKGSLYLTRDVR